MPYRELLPSAPLSRNARLSAPGTICGGSRSVPRSDAEFDALFERVGDRYGLLVERSSEYLRWRYLDRPAGGPRLLAAMRAPGLPVVGWFGSRPRWLARELDALGLVRRPEPQGLVTGLAPFVGGDAVSLMRRGYYTKGDSDLF